jgi:hypothetical protein
MRKLRISPIGVVPQRDRRPRTIVDYSFCDVNEDTAPWAPAKAMQFGRALHRILRMILEAHPRVGPVYISKVDIADGFYRVWLLPSDIPTLGVTLPTTNGEEPMIGFPLALPMGWVNSPPYFTAATETIADLANAAVATTTQFPSHRLEAISETDPDSVADCQRSAIAKPCSSGRHRRARRPDTLVQPPTRRLARRVRRILSVASARRNTQQAPSQALPPPRLGLRLPRP